MVTSVKELLALGYEYAHELLCTDGGFPPFVILLDVLDRRKVIVSDDGTVESLRDILAERYRRDVPKVLALFSEVEVRDSEERGAEAHRAISVRIDVYSGPNTLVLTPIFEGHGSVQLGEPTIMDVDERLIRRD